MMESEARMVEQRARKVVRRRRREVVDFGGRVEVGLSLFEFEPILEMRETHAAGERLM